MGFSLRFTFAEAPAAKAKAVPKPRPGSASPVPSGCYVHNGQRIIIGKVLGVETDGLNWGFVLGTELRTDSEHWFQTEFRRSLPPQSVLPQSAGGRLPGLILPQELRRPGGRSAL